MNKEYYTPQIEDFYIGYECEVNWNRGYEETFVPITLKICNNSENGKRDCYCSNIEEVLIAYDDGYAEFRTHFLTKEQLENEGWQVTDEGVDSCGNPIFYKEYQNELNIFNCKYYLEFTYCNGDFGISLYMKRSLFDDSVVSHKYTGNCPSINEFRKICKLLEIE